MGLFKKKSDPISDRARALNQEIAALEAQIEKLSAQQPPNASEAKAAPARPDPSPPPPQTSPAKPSPQPRLRSTAMPHHRHSAPFPTAAPIRGREPIFEELEQKPLEGPSHSAALDHQNQLDVRKSDLNSSWKRLKNHFRGPPTSNPKLVNYLAAGSIQGLRPLRYERRVARNRFIFSVLILVAVLWGLIAILKHR
jgi:hypothetical protein